MLDRWARQFRVSARRPLELLSAVGRDLPGAVEMLAPGEQPSIDADGVAWLSEEDVAAELRRVRDDEAAWLPVGVRGRWSLGGAHAKVALVFQNGRWGRPGGGTPTNRILKPAIAELPDHDVNEHLCVTAARLSGLPAVPSAIASFGDERAMVVARFDRRVRSDGTVERIHHEDMCQALAVDPSRKHESEQGPTAARIAALLAEEVGPPESRKAVWAFFGALVFNWVIAGPDAWSRRRPTVSWMRWRGTPPSAWHGWGDRTRRRGRGARASRATVNGRRAPQGCPRRVTGRHSTPIARSATPSAPPSPCPRARSRGGRPPAASR